MKTFVAILVMLIGVLMMAAACAAWHFWHLPDGGTAVLCLFGFCVLITGANELPA